MHKFTKFGTDDVIRGVYIRGILMNYALPETIGVNNYIDTFLYNSNSKITYLSSNRTNIGGLYGVETELIIQFNEQFEPTSITDIFIGIPNHSSTGSILTYAKLKLPTQA